MGALAYSFTSAFVKYKNGVGTVTFFGAVLF